MSKAFKFKVMFFLLLPIAFTPGCLPETRKVVVVPETPPTQPPPLSVDTLDKKIAYLTSILEERELDVQDKVLVSSLLADYKTIRSYLQGSSPQYDETEIIQLLFANLGRLEEEYFLRVRVHGPGYSKALSVYSDKREKILNEYLAGDYEGVIDDCIDLEASFGPDSLTPDIGLLFSVSLAKRGMLNEAIIVSEKIIRELEGKPDLIHLRAHIIEWQLDLGNRDKALQIYEKMTDDLDEKEALLAKSKQMVMENRRTAHRQNIPPEAYSRSTTPLDTRGDTQGSTEELLKAVNDLVQRHEFGEAKLLLIKRKIRAEEGPEMETIDQALRTVDLAEERYLEEKEAKLAYEKETLKLARNLIEEENFEEAIMKIETLRDEQSMTPEMRELKNVATEKLIKRDRDKAAKYFLMARKTTDPTKKEQLLLSSYDLLKALIDRYPSSPMLEKLEDNLRTVKAELKKLGKEPGS